MTRELKIWGERWLIRKDSTHAVSYLDVKGGYRCSWHSHATKYNLFVVLTGHFQLVIEEMEEKVLIDLSPGESFTIKPGQFHEFRGLKDSQVIEEMYVEYDEADINRAPGKLGGKIK